jgi:branched-chain amino acid transport system permease protein
MSSTQRALLIAFVWLVLPVAFNQSATLNLLVFSDINLIQAIGLSLLFGYAGQISLGQAGFYAIGAYVSSTLALRTGLPPIAGMFVGTIVAGAVGYVIGRPVLRLRGYYLAMVTAAFGLIVHAIIVEWEDVTGGYSGLTGIPPINLGVVTIDSPLRMFYFAGTIAIIVFLLALRMVRTPYARAMQTMRESEAAARSVGVNISKLKAEVFALAAGLSGLAGALYAHYIGYISPDSFTIDTSINLLLALVIGGVGSIWGAGIGAVLLSFLPEWLHVLKSAYGIAFGAIVIVLLTIEPGGLVAILVSIQERLLPKAALDAPGKN